MTEQELTQKYQADCQALETAYQDSLLIALNEAQAFKASMEAEGLNPPKHTPPDTCQP